MFLGRLHDLLSTAGHPESGRQWILHCFKERVPFIIRKNVLRPVVSLETVVLHVFAFDHICPGPCRIVAAAAFLPLGTFSFLQTCKWLASMRKMMVLPTFFAMVVSLTDNSSHQFANFQLEFVRRGKSNLISCMRNILPPKRPLHFLPALWEAATSTLPFI